jgi:hypothetical protein
MTEMDTAKAIDGKCIMSLGCVHDSSQSYN